MHLELPGASLPAHVAAELQREGWELDRAVRGLGLDRFWFQRGDRAALLEWAGGARGSCTPPARRTSLPGVISASRRSEWEGRGVWFEFPRGATVLLLHDAFLRGAAGERLGRLLRELHAAPPTGRLPDEPDPVSSCLLSPGDTTGDELLADPELGALRERVHARHPPHVAAVHLHGRFSAGNMLVEPDGTLRVFDLPGGWCGPPLEDVGYLAGEYLEAAAGGVLAGESDTAARAVRALHRFLAAYEPEPSEGFLEAVANTAARRLVGHLVAHGNWRRSAGLAPLDERSARLVLRVAERLLDALVSGPAHAGAEAS